MPRHVFRKKSKAGEEKQPQVVQDSTPQSSQKELNIGSTYPDEKIAVKEHETDGTTSPTSTALPPYTEAESSTVSRTRSTALSSAGSSELGPDVNPITRNSMLTQDDGMEVYVPEQVNSPHSQTGRPSGPNRNRQSRSRSYREYSFYYTNAMSHLIICDPDHKVLSFAEMTQFSKGVSDVSMRTILDAGFDDLASKGPTLGLKEVQQVPIVAVADEIPNSMHIKVGLGDPLQPQSQRWFVVSNTHFDKKSKSEKYDVKFQSSDGKETSFLWIKGVSDDAHDKADTKELYRVLTDDGLVASFRAAAAMTLKKRGVLRVYDMEYGETLSFIFLVCAALLERGRRRKVKKGLLMGFS